MVRFGDYPRQDSSNAPETQEISQFSAEALQIAVQSVISSVAHIPKNERVSLLRRAADAIEAGGAD